MEIYEIENFGAGYDDSISPEIAQENTTQDSLMIEYASEIGAMRKDTGERNLGMSYSSVSTDLYPLDRPVQRIYEGRIDVSGSGDFENKRMCIAGGVPFQYCSGDQFIPLSSVTLFSSITTEIPDITHYANTFYIAGGYDFDIMQWNGLNASISTCDGLGFSTSVDYYSGGTTTTTSLGWMYRANCIEVFKNRLFLGNTAESDDGGATWTVHEARVRYSDIGDVDIWSYYQDTYEDASYVDIVDKGGDEVVRLLTYGDELLVFNRNSLHKITFTGGDIPFARTCIDPNTNNMSPWSIASIPDGVLFLNEEGLQITDGQTVAQFPADKKITKLLKRIYSDSRSLCFGISHESNHEYWLSIPVDGSDYCNRIIVYNWKFDTWKIRTSDTSCLGLYTDELSGTWSDIAGYYVYELAAMTWGDSRLYPGSKRMVMGREDGFLRGKSLAYNIDYDDYDSYHITPWLDFDKPGIMKEVLKVQPLWDGTSGDLVTISYKADSDTAWTDLTTDDFAASGISEQPFLYMRKTGRKFRFKIANNNADESFTVYGMKIFYEQRDWR